jgi:hypothetical protein
VPSWLLVAIAPMVRLLGEPLRAQTTPAAMSRLLARHHDRVVRNGASSDFAKLESPQLARETGFATHLHIAIAEWSGAAVSQP